MFYEFKLLSLFAACSVKLAASATLSESSSSLNERSTSQSSPPLPPKQDPFYTAPASFESANPGTVLRIRPAPGNVTSNFNGSSSAYNILFRTTDSRYQPSWAVTTLLVPESVPQSSPNGGSITSALLSYQIPYNSADVDASPSFYLNSPLKSLGIIGTDIATALGHGWYVNVPDFEGPLASFGAGVQEGHATIDSIRAVLSLRDVGLTSDVRYAMWGYSGGSIASEWAAELQVQYAPELNFSGLAIGGVPPNATGLLQNIDGTPAAGLIPSALLGLTSQYPAAYEYLVSKLKKSGPHNSTGFLAAKNFSFVEAHVAFANQSIFDFYFEGGYAALEDPIIQKIFDSDGYMGYHGVPQMPVFVYKAIHDEYSLVGDTDSLVARYCAVGTNVLYQRNKAGVHLDEETNGDARALDWLSSVFDGTYATKYSHQGCTVEDVTVNITSTAQFYFPPG